MTADPSRPTIQHAARCQRRAAPVLVAGWRGSPLYLCPQLRPDRAGARHPDADNGHQQPEGAPDVNINAAAIAEAVRNIPHRPDCTDPERVLLTTRGRALAMRCRACGARRPLETAPDDVTPTTASTPRSRYVCREHLRPVSWHGRDCPECAEDAQNRRQAARSDHPWSTVSENAQLGVKLGGGRPSGLRGGGGSAPPTPTSAKPSSTGSRPARP